MADLVKQTSLVQIATIRRKDIEQISYGRGLYLDDAGAPFQKEPGAARREVEAIGWFTDGGNRFLLVQRVDDGRLLLQILSYEQGKEMAERHPQLFLR